MSGNWNHFPVSKLFSELLYSVQCQNNDCRQYLEINIMDDGFIKFGFVCPQCEKITSGSDMMESLLINFSNSSKLVSN